MSYPKQLTQHIGSARKTIVVQDADDEARFAGMGFVEERGKIGDTIHVRPPQRFAALPEPEPPVRRMYKMLP